MYADELDLLGFDAYWQYERQNDAPYLWAEANCYYYRGILAAKLKGGDVYTAPQIELCAGEDGVSSLPEGAMLRPVDITAMTEKNHPMLTLIEQTTVKKIIAVYEKYRARLDCFHVAFSGGKDSCVLLDLVKKALPQGSFVVVFGDTGMEFPDTYALVDHVEEQCRTEGIPFYRAASHFTPTESWQLFGPPSRTLRWCCSVHKSAPQVLKLREITGKHDYRGLAFVGVRGHESARRASYQYFIDGDKTRGQYGFFPLLEWTSAEIFLYMYAHGVPLNEAYKKGNSRAGCLECPLAASSGDFVRHRSYQKEIAPYVDLIEKSRVDSYTEEKRHALINRGDWKHRTDGRFIDGVKKRYSEETRGGTTYITITGVQSDWKEWMKTLDWDIPYTVEPCRDGYKIAVKEAVLKAEPSKAKIFRQVFRKAAYCSACTVCEGNCRYGCLTFDGGKVKITDCRHCMACHDLPGGCLMYDSLKIPHGGGKKRSINALGAHAPKPEWIVSFFQGGDAFFEDNGLAAPQLLKFKGFLRDAGLTDNLHVTPFFDFIREIGWDTTSAWGLILCNLVAENPQFAWYVRTLELGRGYTRKEMGDMLQTDGLNERSANLVVNAYRRLVATPLGTVLNFGYVTEDGALCRTKCALPDARVFLYGLFKFAEACGDYKAFTLRTLLDDGIERDGISPTQIFGVTRAEAEPLLRGLTARYPEFIDAAFTHDLEKITLAEDRTAADVLELLRTEGA